MPGISRGFHFWQPAPRLNNAPVAGTTLNPAINPHAKEQAPVTLTCNASVERKKGGEMGWGGVGRRTGRQH